MPDPSQDVAFIGLGVMGYGMALNLRSKMDKDQVLYICDTSDDAINLFSSETEGIGPVEIVKNGAEAMKVADTLFTMLPNGAAVKSVYLDETTGVLAGIKATNSAVDKLIVECGTIDTPTILSVAQSSNDISKALSSGSSLSFVDAPVSGGPNGSRNGTLAFMVGANTSSTFERVKEWLVHMGNPNSIFHCGEVGSGTAFKVINNYISATVSVAASEALNIGVKLGYDPKVLTKVINASGGQTWVTSNINPVPGVQPNVPSSNNYEGGFRIELCQKVFEMGMELAERAGARLVLADATLGAFRECSGDERYAGKDARVVYKWLSESS